MLGIQLSGRALECLPRMGEALGLVPATDKTKPNHTRAHTQKSELGVLCFRDGVCA